jgi:hypothetical protein
MRGHDGSTVMVFNNRCMPLLRRGNLLAVANIIAPGISVFNAMTITTMVDRWRPETHSFHLPCGEMTMTLEDVAMILELPIRGRLITNRVESSTWRERVVGFLGREPPPNVSGMKGREAGVHVTWLCGEFCEFPPDVDEATLTLYARAWVWHMFATVLFSDGTGDAASWMYLLTLTN